MLILHGDERIDWFALLVQLDRAGCNINRLSRELDIPNTTIRGWRLGHGRPRFEEALRVIVYWSQRTGQDIARVPVTSLYAPH